MISIFTITLRELVTWLASSIPPTELSQLNSSLWFLQKHNFSECPISVVWSRDPSRDSYCLLWASFLTNLIELLALGWPFTILKAVYPIGQSACLKENLAIFKSSLLELPPIQLNDSILCLLQFFPKSYFCHKNKLTGGTPTKDSNRCMWLFLFTLSILSNQPSKVVSIRLAVYNSKS